MDSFVNDDARLLREVEKAMSRRRKDGLDGLVGNLAAVILNVAEVDLVPAAEELLGGTSLRFEAALDHPLSPGGGPTMLLRDLEGADFLLKSRPAGQPNAFAAYNEGHKTAGAAHRDAAIVEFLELTNYRFDFAVYVESLNSITNVARLRDGDYAQVFTSGIASPEGGGDGGPTEAFIANYGLRPHHLAFTANGIEDVVAGLAANGMAFFSELVGSREEGLKQIFSAMSPRTMLVNEYIERYDGFDGFFTKSNVTRLTKATENQ